MKIEVYLKSIPYNRDVSKQVYQTRFVSCAQYRTSLPDVGLDGRFFDDDNARIMQALDNLPSAVRRDLKVVDVGRIFGWLRARRAGVRQTPTVVVDGCSFSGVAAWNTLTELKSLAS
jgi:hypothetical protein